MGDKYKDILRMINRIKTSPDGQDFINYLEDLSLDNYLAFKRSDPAQSELHKGYALCIDNLIKLFNECDIEIKKKEEIIPDWTN